VPSVIVPPKRGPPIHNAGQLDVATSRRAGKAAQRTVVQIFFWQPCTPSADRAHAAGARRSAAQRAGNRAALS